MLAGLATKGPSVRTIGLVVNEKVGHQTNFSDSSPPYGNRNVILVPIGWLHQLILGVQISCDLLISSNTLCYEMVLTPESSCRLPDIRI